MHTAHISAALVNDMFTPQPQVSCSRLMVLMHLRVGGSRLPHACSPFSRVTALDWACTAPRTVQPRVNIPLA